jgi:hypothetical protein
VGKIEVAFGWQEWILPSFTSYFLLPTQMDDHPSSSRRKKSDKAKEKHERTPYSSQHVRQVITNAIMAAATKAGSGSRKHKNT